MVVWISNKYWGMLKLANIYHLIPVLLIMWVWLRTECILSSAYYLSGELTNVRQNLIWWMKAWVNYLLSAIYTEWKRIDCSLKEKRSSELLGCSFIGDLLIYWRETPAFCDFSQSYTYNRHEFGSPGPQYSKARKTFPV